MTTAARASPDVGLIGLAAMGQHLTSAPHTSERVDAPRGKFFHVDWPDPKRPQQPV